MEFHDIAHLQQFEADQVIAHLEHWFQFADTNTTTEVRHRTNERYHVHVLNLLSDTSEDFLAVCTASINPVSFVDGQNVSHRFIERLCASVSNDLTNRTLTQMWEVHVSLVAGVNQLHDEHFWVRISSIRYCIDLSRVPVPWIARHLCYGGLHYTNDVWNNFAHTRHANDSTRSNIVVLDVLRVVTSCVGGSDAW
ncbi:hypothetical protein D3C75_1004820 [compost metagenome]